MQTKREQTQHRCVIATPVGKIGVTLTNGVLTKLEYLPARSRLVAPYNPQLRAVVTQLEAYFSKPNFSFTFPFHLEGTPRQQKIWQALQKIPYGKRVTYGEVARLVGTGPRVVGNACRRNPIPIVVPCHRVVAAIGLGGYSGSKKGEGVKTKSWLLAHESSH